MLLVDLGNSRLKWASLAENSALHDSVCVNYQQGASLDLIACLDAHWRELPAQAVVMVSVANQKLTAQLIHWCQLNWQQTPRQVYALASASGIRNAYAEPARLGADRWAAMIAAYRYYGGSVCVLDAGTAVTLDIVSASGQHHGGIILPGVAALWQSLHAATAAVLDTAHGAPLPPATPLGQDTQTCVASGIWHALAGGIERALRQFESSDLVDQSAQRHYVITGGNAPLLANLLKADWQQDADLVLRGLAVFLADERADEQADKHSKAKPHKGLVD